MSLRRTTSACTTIKTEQRNVALFQTNELIPLMRHAEVDSHADTCRVNNTARIVSYTGKGAHVSAYSPELEVLKDIPIVKAAVAYDNAITGETYIVKLNQALYFGDALTQILITPNQLQANGVDVYDAPRHSTKGKSPHMIRFPQDSVQVPLVMKGIISYFPVRTPSQKEIDDCLILEATAKNTEWEPSSTEFQETEDKCIDPKPETMLHRHLNYVHSENHDISDTMIRNISSLPTANKKLYVEAEDLTQKWGVGKTLAEATIKAMTQKFIHSSVDIERKIKALSIIL
jgi:hypothetical protein